jgi:hypothetical protein
LQLALNSLGDILVLEHDLNQEKQNAVLEIQDDIWRGSFGVFAALVAVVVAVATPDAAPATAAVILLLLLLHLRRLRLSLLLILLKLLLRLMLRLLWLLLRLLLACCRSCPIQVSKEDIAACVFYCAILLQGVFKGSLFSLVVFLAWDSVGDGAQSNLLPLTCCRSTAAAHLLPLQQSPAAAHLQLLSCYSSADTSQLLLFTG